MLAEISLSRIETVATLQQQQNAALSSSRSAPFISNNHFSKVARFVLPTNLGRLEMGRSSNSDRRAASLLLLLVGAALLRELAP